MKKFMILLAGVMFFGFCLAVAFAQDVYAQQGGTQGNQPNDQRIAERKALEQQHHALKQKIQEYRHEEQQLLEQIKHLREQLRSMHERHQHEIRVERERLQAEVRHLRAEGREWHGQTGNQHGGQQQSGQSPTPVQHK